MEYTFSETASFNQPLSKWKVSNVRCMNGMFKNAKNFNQPILFFWKVPHTEEVESMFTGATFYNQKSIPRQWKSVSQKLFMK